MKRLILFVSFVVLAFSCKKQIDNDHLVISCFWYFNHQNFNTEITDVVYKNHVVAKIDSISNLKDSTFFHCIKLKGFNSNKKYYAILDYTKTPAVIELFDTLFTGIQKTIQVENNKMPYQEENEKNLNESEKFKMLLDSLMSIIEATHINSTSVNYDTAM